MFSSGTHTLTTHKHDGFTIENWLSRGRAQLLLIFVRFAFCCFTRKNDYVKRKKKTIQFQALKSSGPPRMVAKRFPQSGNNKNSTHTRGRLLPRTNNHYDLNPRNHTSPVWWRRRRCYSLSRQKWTERCRSGIHQSQSQKFATAAVWIWRIESRGALWRSRRRRVEENA